MRLFIAALIFKVIVTICNGQVRNTYFQRGPGSSGSSSWPNNIRIGGLFDDVGDPLEEVAFKHAVERINSNLAASNNVGTTLSSKIERIQPGSSFFANDTKSSPTKACRLLNEGVALIIGPKNSESACHVQSICDAFEILHIETKWDYHICKKQRMINLFPHPEILSIAITDLVEYMQWDNITILYDDGLQLVESLLNSASVPPKKIILRKLPPDDDYRLILEEIQDQEYFTNIIVNCDAYKTEVVLKQAQQVGLMNRNYNYILTSLDIHTMHLEDYMYGKIPIRAFRLVDPDRSDVIQVISQFNSLAGLDLKIHQTQLQLESQLAISSSTTSSNSWKDLHFSKEAMQRIISSSKSMPLSIALIYDAVQLFGHILPQLADKVNTLPMKCDGIEMGTGHGSTLMNLMKTAEIDGLSGPVSFGKSGFRTDILMDIVELQKEGIKKLGTWSSRSSSRFNWERTSTDTKQQTVEDDSMPIKQRTFTVVTIQTKPFCMLKENTTVLKDNERFEGYNVDLIEKLSEILGFKYKFKWVYDEKSYGSYFEKTKTWDGMIKEILEGTADIAIGDLAINEIRQTAVDFSMPHMNLGISILYVVPMAKPPGLLSFMNPFAPHVWFCTCLAFFGVSLTLFIIARVSPKEWDCPMPCVENPTKLYNQFSLSNSIWFSVGSIMQQGSDLAPKATSTRIVGAMWWFFTLIMVSSYTASLATFLIVQDKDDSIKDLGDLVAQDKVKFGCVGSGSTRNFFKNAPEGTDVYRANQKMEKMVPSPFMVGNADGVRKVLDEKGKYAFFMESTLIDYNKEIHCGLTQLGNPLDNKGYGIVLPKNSTYLREFNGAVLQLQEKGELSELKRKWWKVNINPPVCEGSGVSGNVQALELANVGGVFVVLVVGCLLAILVDAFEFFWGWKKASQLETHISKKDEMINELKFALQCGGNVKANLYHKPSISTKSGETGEISIRNSKGGSTPYIDQS